DAAGSLLGAGIGQAIKRRGRASDLARIDGEPQRGDIGHGFDSWFVRVLVAILGGFNRGHFVGTVRILAGDLGKHNDAYFSLAGTLSWPKGLFSTERIDFGREADRLEVQTEQSIKKLGATVGWAAAGALLAGPVGLLLGGIFGGRNRSQVC